MEELRTRKKKWNNLKTKTKHILPLNFKKKLAIPKQPTKQARGLIFPDFKTYYKASNWNSVAVA